MTSLTALPAELLGISQGDRVGVGTDGVTVDGGLWLKWSEVLPGF